MADPILPPQFAELEAQLDWALPSEAERRRKRMTSSMGDLQAFYDAVFPRLDAMLTYLNDFPLDAMPADAQRLLLIAISMTEVSVAVEVVRHPGVPDGINHDRIVPVHSW